MDAQLIQNLRYKLQKRIKRLNSVSALIFPQTLKQFWSFFDEEPIFNGIKEKLLYLYPEITKVTERIKQQELLLGETETESAAIGYEVLRDISNSDVNRILDYSLAFSRGNLEECLDAVRDIFLEPFYEYIDEQLDDQKAILSLLYRYKHKCEWFLQKQLLELYEHETKKGEKLLALNLYEYLFDQGINFTIEPSSIDGAIDLISAQNSEDPLLADAKLFKGDKTYICKGFGQLYSYTKKYNEPFGYLLIYNVTDKDLSFLFSNSGSTIPVVTYNHKTIFLITIDLYKHSEPPSKRGLVKSVEIKEEDLFEFVEKEAAI